MTTENLHHENCTGCGACCNLCNFNAITMEPNADGFLNPVIDSDKCMDCGMCVKICPLEHPSYDNSPDPKCYAFCAENDVRKVSSSGGAFSVFAEKILEEDGIVYGAAMSEDLLSVKFIGIESKGELYLLRGSKYMQSDTGDTFQQVKENLKHGKRVLYTGLPCQIAGLKTYLGVDYDNLYTIDLICHGATSPKVWRKYLKEQEEKHGNIFNAFFRTKDLSQTAEWARSVAMKLKTERDGIIYENRDESDYLFAFNKSISNNKYCGKCLFAKLPRQGDLTIGDFWGITDFDKSLNDGLGTSVVLVNTKKGGALLQAVSDKAKILREVPIEAAIPKNKPIVQSPWVNPRSERFYQILDNYDLKKATEYALKRKFDLGFVGWWYGANYGSVLTNFALYTVLTNDLAKTVLMIQYPDSNVLSSNSKSARFAKKHYDVTKPRKLDAYSDLNWYCEKFILGSDQLWNWYSTKGVKHHFFLDWVDEKKIKIAYATSFGHSKSFYPKEERLEIADLLQQFNSISVREEDGINILKEEFGTRAEHTLDPVFLCDKAHYDTIASEVDSLSKEPYVYAYILTPTEEKKNLIYKIAEQLNQKVIILIDGQTKNKKEYAQIMGEKDVFLEVEIEQWLRLIQDAHFVVTDSFHGMCFSIMNHKKFMVIKNAKRGNVRFESVANMLGIQDRLLEDPEEMDSVTMMQLLENEIDYSKIDEILDCEKEKSMEWLVDALKKPRRSPTYNQMVYAKLKDLDDKVSALQKDNK